MERITIVSGLAGGRPTIRGMRIRVQDVLEMLASGTNEAQILESFPDLEAADIQASLAYAARELDHPGLVGHRTTTRSSSRKTMTLSREC